MVHEALILITGSSLRHVVFDSWGEVLAAWGQAFRHFWVIALVSFLVALAATPVVRRVALKRGIVDRPDEFLKPHGRPIPYLGGVAIFAGWLAGILLALLVTAPNTLSPAMIGVAIAGLATMLTGLFDDLRVMSPRIKLACNIGVGAILLAFGLGDDIINVITQITGMTFQGNDRWLELAYSVPITILIIVGACNATNLIDGLDGLCSGVLGIISLGFVILALHLNVLYPDAPFAGDRLVLALSMLGAALGFLPYNVNPAKVFMGDAGSMLLGLNAAVLLLMFGEQRILRWMIGAVMVFGLPVADMLLTMVRRWRNGKPIMTGDRSHYYDQLRDRGLSVRRVAAISYLLALAFVLVGTSVVFIKTRYTPLAFLIATLASLGLVWKFNMAGIESKNVTAAGESESARSSTSPENRSTKS